MRPALYCLSLALLGSSAFNVHAGGPLVLEGSTGNTPVNYTGPVSLNLDQGPLLNGLTNTVADNIVIDAINVWNNVPTATVQINQGADLATDITVANYTSVLSDQPNSPTSSDMISPVIYDVDGSIIDAFFGAGTSDFVAGFASSIFQVGGDEFLEGYAVLNGKPSLGMNANEMTTVVIHEIGHLIGMDHSQLDINNTENSTTACTSALSSNDYPAMYPYLCRNDLGLHADDIIAVSSLYPITNLDQQYGQLRGHFLDNGSPIIGANLWVEETTSGDKYSIVSDYLMQSTGFFGLLLPPGNYTLHANAINPDFDADSSVGPYASNAADASFVGIPSLLKTTTVDYEADTGSTVSVAVVAGEAVDITFNLDGTGSNTGGNAIVDPATLTPPSSGSSSSIGLLTLLMLLSAPLCRAFRKT